MKSAVPEPAPPEPAPPRHHWRGAFALLLVCLAAAAALSSDQLHAALLRVLAIAEPVITAHPRIGAVVFVLFSAGSAMLAFFSSALLVPVAVLAWDRWLTIVLLWLGWLLGGICAYAVGRSLGRPLVQTVASSRLLAFYQRNVAADVGFPMVLLLQLALPSEIPGYLFGLLGVRFRTYFLALALAEIPFAVGTVLLGETVLRQQGGWLLALGAAGAAILLLAAYLLHRRLGRGRARPPSS